MPSCWWRARRPAAAAAVFAWLVGREEVRRVFATCDVENAASVRVLEKIGMARERVLPGHAIRPNLAPGIPRDALLYSWAREA